MDRKEAAERLDAIYGEVADMLVNATEEMFEDGGGYIAMEDYRDALAYAMRYLQTAKLAAIAED